MKTANYNVTGMSCAACANAVEKALNKNEGIEAKVNIATEKVNLQFDESKYDFIKIKKMQIQILRFCQKCNTMSYQQDYLILPPTR